MLKIWFKGKHFFVEDDAACPDKKPSGVEKAQVNEIVAADHEWPDLLDVFTGCGISSYIFSKHAKRVFASKTKLAILRRNIEED